MASKYQDWLAAQVINEANPVTYRSLSRALKVHSNAAKEMLYDFHRTQNARKPGSLHATYLLTGVRKPQAPPETNGHSSSAQSDGDILMSDMSFMSSSMPGQDVELEVEVIPMTTITLVKEEDLEAVKESYEELQSIHVYSLEPSTLKNLQVLSDCNRKITVDHVSDDLLQTWKQYGTIYNPLAKRRTGARPPPPPPAVSKPATTTAPPKAATKAPTPDPITKPALSRTTSTKSDASKSETTSKKSTTTSKPPTLKKESSSIFAAFAAKPKSTSKSSTTTRPTRSNSASQTSAAASPAPAQDDTTMLDVDDDEGEEEDPFAGNALDKTKADSSRAARSEREANLRKMMEADDDENDVGGETADADEDEVMAEEGETSAPVPLEPTADGQGLKPQSPEANDEGEPTVTVSNGRRRGRRRVMKKKTTKDAEGYLVTKEEMGWESFSESDREPEKKKIAAAKPAPAAPGGGGAGAGKKGSGAAAKKGQGNIMSFFSKK